MMGIKPADTTTRPVRVRRTRAVVAAVAAACAAWLLIERLGGVDLQAPAFGDASTAQNIDFLNVLLASLTASLAGWLAIGLIERYTAQPGRWWIILAMGVLVLSLSGPISGPGIGNTNRVLLALLHLIVASILIPLFYRTIENRAERT